MDCVLSFKKRVFWPWKFWTRLSREINLEMQQPLMGLNMIMVYESPSCLVLKAYLNTLFHILLNISLLVIIWWTRIPYSSTAAKTKSWSNFIAIIVGRCTIVQSQSLWSLSASNYSILFPSWNCPQIKKQTRKYQEYQVWPKLWAFEK